MRRGIPWLIAAVLLVTAVASGRAARDDGGATFVTQNKHVAQDRVVLALKASDGDRVVLPLNRTGQVIHAVRERPDAPATLPAADEQALFGIDAPPVAGAKEVDVAVVSPELPVVEERPRKRVQFASRSSRERCGRACKAKRFAVGASSRKRAGGQAVAAKDAPEIMRAAGSPKRVELRVPVPDSAPAFASEEPSAIGSGGIRLDDRTSLNFRPLSSVMPARTPDNGDGRSAFTDERDDPSRSGVAAGFTFKLN